MVSWRMLVASSRMAFAFMAPDYSASGGAEHARGVMEDTDPKSPWADRRVRPYFSPYEDLRLKAR
jgi:hypothetical protein